MKIFVKAKPKSKENKVDPSASLRHPTGEALRAGKIDNQHFTVSVKEPPIDNKANIAIIELLSEYFDVSISNIRLIAGRTTKNKVFEINPVVKNGY